MLTEAWKPLRPHKQQSAATRTKKRFVVIQAGRGSGKTDISRRRDVRMLAVNKPWPDPMYFYALPTREWAKRVAWEKLQALVPTHWHRRHNPVSHSDLTIKTRFGSTLWLLGMDRPERAEGVQWDGGVIDERADQKPTVWNAFMPAFSERNAWCWQIGVCKRSGVGAPSFNKIFDYAASGVDPEWEAYHWKSSTVLSADELASARKSFSEEDFRELYEASRESMGGTVFHAFDKHLNVDGNFHYDPDLPLIIGSDFNVDPMSWVMCQEVGDELLVHDEIWERHTHTQATLDELWNRYKHSQPVSWIFHGDAASQNRNTATATTDYLIIAQDERFKPRRVLYPAANPPVVDRFASCNAMFCNAAGQRRVRIHPRCKHLIEDLEARSYKQGTRIPNDKGDVSHMSDALGYVIHIRHPLELTPQGTGRASTHG